jgi:glutathione S-transferase
VAIPEIIGSSRSTYTRVACMVCEEKGIEYVLTERPLRAPEILAIHPFGKMPVLRHGDVELFESKAIATYLDRSFPAPFVFPSDPCLAALTEPDRAAIRAVMPTVREQLGVLDKAVAGSGHLVGDQFTFADINLMPILHRVRQAPGGAQALAATTHLAAYYDRHAARPSFQRTDPPSGPPGRAKPG